MNKKIKITLHKNVYDVVEYDLNDFNISKNYFMNYLFYNLKDIYIPTQNYSNNLIPLSDEKRTIQFTLNKKNSIIYYEVLKENNVQNESEFMRNILNRYTSNTRSVREIFIFKEIVERLNYSIKNKRKIILTFNDDRKVKITPFYIGSSSLEVANYLFSYDENIKDYKNYRLCNIKDVYILEENGYWNEKEKIENFIRSFDPFLSNGKKIKVELSERGIELLKNLRTNRPKLLNKKDNIFEFECSEEHARKYFSYFLDEFKILEPDSLKNFFITKFENAVKKFKT